MKLSQRDDTSKRELTQKLAELHEEIATKRGEINDQVKALNAPFAVLKVSYLETLSELRDLRDRVVEKLLEYKDKNYEKLEEKEELSFLDEKIEAWRGLDLDDPELDLVEPIPALGSCPAEELEQLELEE